MGDRNRNSRGFVVVYFKCPACGFHITLAKLDFPIRCRCTHRSEWPEGITDEAPSGPQPAWHPIAKRGPCKHLGDEVRREQCDSCSGKVLLKIFACEVHGECTTQKPLPGVPCCGGCEQYEASQLTPGAGR